ncbi:MAG TPA: sulfotransferase [Anaerolineales bacterium]|nr:sulfotransferase [Anaerolineales bacterium]
MKNNKLLDLKKRISLAGYVLRTGQAPLRSRRDIPAITPEEVTEAKAFFPMPKFFIFGHARSGTTLLTRLIRLHPEIHCNYQAHFFTRQPLLQALVSDEVIGEWLSRRSNRWNRGRDLSPVVLRAAADFILERDARREGKHIVGDKSPNSLLEDESVRLVQKVYPEAQLIVIIRDGRDMAVSHRFQSFIDAAQHLNREDLRIRDDFSRDAGLFLSGRRSIFTDRAIRSAASGWARNVTETDKVAQQLFGERYLNLRYEDLLERPQAELERIWTFLGVYREGKGLAEAVIAELGSNPDADWQKHKAGELVEPLEKGKQGSWRNLFTARDRLTFKEMAGQALITWGYEQNLDW